MSENKVLKDMGEIKEILSNHGFTPEESAEFLDLIYSYGFRKKIIEQLVTIGMLKEEKQINYVEG
jgi:hypothetical protein